MKKLVSFLAILFSLSAIFASGKADKKQIDVVASTSWTAAFADLAGVDEVETIAPATLRHPPEYEVTVSDIEKITTSKFFIYAGFERMMKTLGDAVGNTQMIKIHCNNSVDNIKTETAKIASSIGTTEKSKERVERYIKAVEDGKNKVEKLKGKKVLCNINQIYLAKDLGLEVVATFGPGQVTSEQIANAKNGDYDFIIDNVHNPVGTPLSEVAPNAKYVVWRNFPEIVEKDALTHVIQGNINSLIN